MRALGNSAHATLFVLCSRRTSRATAVLTAYRADTSCTACLCAFSFSTTEEELDRRVEEYRANKPAAPMALPVKVNPSEVMVSAAKKS